MAAQVNFDFLADFEGMAEPKDTLHGDPWTPQTPQLPHPWHYASPLSVFPLLPQDITTASAFLPAASKKSTKAPLLRKPKPKPKPHLKKQN
jgi:hypothetical protein